MPVAREQPGRLGRRHGACPLRAGRYRAFGLPASSGALGRAPWARPSVRQPPGRRPVPGRPCGPEPWFWPEPRLGLRLKRRPSAGGEAVIFSVKNEMPRIRKHMDLRKLRAAAARRGPGIRYGESVFRKITGMHFLDTNLSRRGEDEENTSKMQCSTSDGFIFSRLDRRNHQSWKD